MDTQLHPHDTAPRILIAEPRPLLGALMMHVLGTLRLRGVGPFACKDCSLMWLDETEDTVAAAIISTGFPDGEAYALAAELDARGLPFAFISKAEHHIPWEFRDVPVIRLPYDVDDVRHALLPLLRSPLRLQLPGVKLSA